MAETRVKFARQEQADNLLQLCRLIEAEYLQQRRVLVVMAEEEKALALDRYLWTWDKAAFLPHVFDNGALPTSGEPIVISLHENNANGATVLIMEQPCSEAFMQGFAQIIDFARTYDPQLLEASRQRFRDYRSRGWQPEML